MLYIWTQDHGWAGSIVVVKETEAEARKAMSVAPNYSDKQSIKKHEIKDGFVFYNLGDF